MKKSLVRSLSLYSLLVVSYLITCESAQAAIRRVPADHPTIQQAIEASVDGDIVLVAPGTYVENINFNGRAITVKSESGPSVTVIDGSRLKPVVKFNSGEGRNSILMGFTIRNGSNGRFIGNQIIIEGAGSGISIEGSSPTITNNIITENNGSLCLGAGGIGVSSGSPLIEKNIIRNNMLPCLLVSSAGIFLNNPLSVEITDNTISNNEGHTGGGIGMITNANSVVLIKNNVITHNIAFTGGGIGIRGSAFNSASNVSIVQNLVSDNAAVRGGGIYFVPSPRLILNNTIAENGAQRGPLSFRPCLCSGPNSLTT